MIEIEMIKTKSGKFVPKSTVGELRHWFALAARMMYVLSHADVNREGGLYNITPFERKEFDEWCTERKIKPIFSLSQLSLLDEYQLSLNFCRAVEKATAASYQEPITLQDVFPNYLLE